MQLVTRTLTVLRHLGEYSQGETLNDLAAALRIPSPTLHRLLSVLISEDFVVRSSDKRYTLGPAALSLANGARPLARVIDQEIKRRLGDELLFGALENGGKVTVDYSGTDFTFSFESKREDDTEGTKDRAEPALA